MTWDPEVEELKRRRELARAMGGPDNVERQHKAGRLTVRERIERLLDLGSFHETGALAGAATYDGDKLVSIRPANFVMGTGRIDGRRVVVGGDDFTVRGGANDASIGGKQGYGERMARELRLPIVRLVDGTGGGGSVKTYEITGRTYVPGNPAWDIISASMSEIPVLAAALGPVAGLGAARVRAIEARLNVYRNPFRAAEAFNIEEIIDPRDTRPLLTDWIALAYDNEATRLGPKTRGMRP